MQKKVYILGGYQSDFSQNWYRNELDLLDVFKETISHGLTSVDIEPKDIDVAHVGNFTAELFCNQGHLGGFFVSSHPDFFGLPSSRKVILLLMSLKKSCWFKRCNSCN